MRLLGFALLAASLLACAGCGGRTSAQGGGSNNGGYGGIKVGLPF